MQRRRRYDHCAALERDSSYVLQHDNDIVNLDTTSDTNLSDNCNDAGCRPTHSSLFRAGRLCR